VDITPINMKGVQILYDDSGHKRLLQIDLNEVDERNEAIEDLIDIILAEAAKDEEKYDWEDVKALLKKEGKL